MVDDNPGVPDGIPVRLLWVDLDETPVHAVNQFIAQIEQDEIFFTFGVVTPPVLTGTPEERLSQAQALGYVAVKPVGRVVVTRRRLDEMIGTLQEIRTNYDHLHGGD